MLKHRYQNSEVLKQFEFYEFFIVGICTKKFELKSVKNAFFNFHQLFYTLETSFESVETSVSKSLILCFESEKEFKSILIKLFHHVYFLLWNFGLSFCYFPNIFLIFVIILTLPYIIK